MFDLRFNLDERQSISFHCTSHTEEKKGCVAQLGGGGAGGRRN
jgi:hypothetical protein